MVITHDKARDGKTLLHVVYERESPEANSPTIEVVYALRLSEDFTNPNPNPRVIEKLSSTVTDTRVHVDLTDEEKEIIGQEAAEYANRL